MDTRAKEIIKYLKNIGIIVSTSTKARGNQGFYLENKIYISKGIPEERIIPTLVHEFTHYIHSKIEPFMEKTGGSINVIFDDDNSKYYENELIAVTNFVDNNSKFEKLLAHKQIIKNKIKDYEEIIQNRFPKFMRSKKFKEFDKYIKHSDAKYLLKYDRIKLIKRGFTKTTKLYTIDNIENDFMDMPKEFAAYIRLKSCQKRQSRISSKINKMNKYYHRPTELFARFVEGLYINAEQVKQIAPNSYKRFTELLETGYYKELTDFYLSFIHNC